MVSKTLIAYSLRRNTLWNLFGTLVYSGCQWSLLIMTVKMLQPVDAGRLSLGFAISAPVFLLFQLRLRTASATDAQRQFNAADYIRLRSICTLLALATTFGICRAIGLSRSSLAIVLWVAAAKAIESGSDLLYGFSQQKEEFNSIAFSMTARGLLAGLSFWLLLAKMHRLDLALAALCCSWAAVFLFIDVPQGYCRFRASMVSAGQVEPRRDGLLLLLKLARVTLPLGLSTMFMSLTANMPRYFIQRSLGLGLLGIFSAAGYLTMTISVVIGAIAEASVPRLAMLIISGQRAAATLMLHRIRSITLLLSGLSFGVSAVAGKRVLSLIYRSEYGYAHGLLIALMIAAGAANLASIYGYVLIAARQFNHYLVTLMLAALSTAASCAVAVPRWGAMGAAIACLVGYSVQWAASRFLLRPTLALEANASVPAMPVCAVLDSQTGS